MVVLYVIGVLVVLGVVVVLMRARGRDIDEMPLPPTGKRPSDDV